MRELTAFAPTPYRFASRQHATAIDHLLPSARTGFQASLNEYILLGTLDPVILEPTVIARSEQVFEPVLNVPALGTFLFISIVFSLLQIRTSQVETAVQERKKALGKLRQIKSLELTEEFDPATVQQALEQFEQAVQTEERLRNIIPGVARIVPPNAANDPAEQDARAAAKQFLGKEYDIGMEQRNNSNTDGVSTSPNAISSPGAIIVLVLVFLSQVALLLFLGQDPMSTPMANM